ncbi:MAG TPA: hypothetical protein VJ302_08955 [Blastocatellia bacterium]|nr:hypothetical protein [Blastocatellia bacterium]
MNRLNHVLLVIGLSLITMGSFGQLLLILQYLGVPILPPEGPDPWYTSLGLIPLGIILVILSVQLYKRSQNRP